MAFASPFVMYVDKSIEPPVDMDLPMIILVKTSKAVSG